MNIKCEKEKENLFFFQNNLKDEMGACGGDRETERDWEIAKTLIFLSTQI